jgi:adenosylhomocysteinase
MDHIIKDSSLADAGKKRMTWYRSQMKLMRDFYERYGKEQPFAGMRIMVCMHCEPKAAFRMEVLLNGDRMPEQI